MGRARQLQEPGVSHFTTPEDNALLTLSPHIIPEAASTQRSPAVNTTTPGILEPDRCADLVPPPHDTPPPDKGAEPPTDHLPIQTRAPTDAEGRLESVWSEEPRRAMGQTGPAPAHTPEGKMPVSEDAAHAYHTEPLMGDLDDDSDDEWGAFRTETWGAEDVAPHTPTPTNLAACLGSASQLEGEQNFHMLCVGSELHATPPASQFSPFSPSPLPPLDTLARENPPREGAASEWRAIDTCPECWDPPDWPCGEGAAIERRDTEARRPEPWKPLDPHDEVLQESGGALSAPGNLPVIQDPLGPAAMAENADVRLPEPSSVNAHERGGALPVVGAAPALAEDTAGVEPADEAKKAAAAKS